jgi:hypothetical protein
MDDNNDGEDHQNHDDEEERGTSMMTLPPKPQREYDKLVDATSGGDKRKQRLLPYNFDYACKGNGPMMNNGDNQNSNNMNNNHKRPRVMSLLDPTQTLDYEYELWQSVFQPVQTLDELEERYALGREKIETHAQVKKKLMTTVKQRPGRPSNAATAAATAAAAAAESPPEEKDNTRSNNNNNINNEYSQLLLPHHGCQHTYAVKRNLREWFAKYSRIDAHSLGRLRVKDRHSAPPLLHSNDGSNTTTTSTYVRFEILRHSQNLKRGSGVDGSRLEVELHGEQRTLLDLHCVIVESALNKEAGVHSIDDDNNNNNNNDNDKSVVSGIFFIENTFYTCGKVGTNVAEAITRWLDEDSNNEEGSTTLLTSRRRKFLGMLPSQLHSTSNAATKIIPMSEIKLEDLSLRLGVRYFHMFIPPPTPSSLRLLFQGQGQHDEVDEESSRKNHSSWSLATESAVFVTGIHTIPLSKTDSLSKKTEVNNEEKDETIGTKQPILIHDTWAAPQRHICYACNHSPASVVTVNDELTDAAPPGLDDRTNKIYLQGVPLCSPCYRALHYCRHENIDNGIKELKLRSSEHDQAFLVFSIEEYERLVSSSSLDDVPPHAGF